MGISYLKFKRARRKGVKRFRKQLKDSGLSKDQIEELTKQYEDMGRVRNYLRGTTSFLGNFGL
jgi:SOS response regulatory protein OraA/RecX